MSRLSRAVEWMFGTRRTFNPPTLLPASPAVKVGGATVRSESTRDQAYTIDTPMFPAAVQRDAAVRGASAGSAPTGGWSPLGVGQNQTSTRSDESWASTFETSAALSNPISNLATDVAKVKWVLKRRLKNEFDRDKDPLVTDHGILDLLHKPHPRLTRFQWFRTVTEYLILTGKAPVKFSQRSKHSLVRSPGKKTQSINPPTLLEIIPPHWIRQYPGLDDMNFHLMWWNSVAQEVPSADIMYLYEPSLLNPYGPGLGQAQAISGDVDQDRAMSEFNRYYFRNMAFLGAIVNIPGSDPDEMKESWRQDKEGTVNAYKTLFTNGESISVTNLSPNMKELNFVEGQNAKHAIVNHRFNQSAQRQGNFTSASRAELEAADYHQQKNAVVPYCIYLKEAFNMFLVPEWGEDDLYLDYVDPVEQAVAAKQAAVKDGVQLGYLTINEARKANGYADLPDGDCLLIPSNNVVMVPVAEIAEWIATSQRILISNATNPNHQNEPDAADSGDSPDNPDVSPGANAKNSDSK